MLRTRLAVHRARPSGTPEQAAQCDQILASDEMLAALNEELHEQHKSAQAGLPPGTITSFLDWLIKNLPTILAAVAAVIAMFG